MDKSDCSFQQLPFSKLFKTYISDFETISSFYGANPFSEEEVAARAGRVSKFVDRNKLIEALFNFHEYLGIADEQQEQRTKLSNSDTLAIVTGQQLGMYGGPLFTIYKTITTILLARKWEQKLNQPVVPVFWLADEDHDFEEIASIGVPEFDGMKSVMLSEQGNGKPVSEQFINHSIHEFNSALKEFLHETDFSAELWNQLNETYSEGRSHVQAFGQLMSHWFSKHGVLFAGSNFEPIKKLGGGIFSSSILKSDLIHSSLEEKSKSIEENFHRQVVVNPSNLFYLDKEKGRQKINKTGAGWSISGTDYSTEKLLDIVDEHPEKFSPNVFLRPVLQDYLLPSFGYVAGPGELSYYGQMKDLYPHFNMEMPVIFPRLSATLLESGIARIMEKLPFQMCNYNQRIEDLEAQYIEEKNTNDVDGVFGAWIEDLHGRAKEPVSLIKEIDPTLEGAAGKVVAGFENEINKLKGRLFRSIKQQEETQLKRIPKIKSQLFPDGLQERSVNPVFYMNKYGVEIWDKLLNEFEQEGLDLSVHHVISL